MPALKRRPLYALMKKVPFKASAAKNPVVGLIVLESMLGPRSVETLGFESFDDAYRRPNMLTSALGLDLICESEHRDTVRLNSKTIAWTSATGGPLDADPGPREATVLKLGSIGTRASLRRPPVLNNATSVDETANWHRNWLRNRGSLTRGHLNLLQPDVASANLGWAVLAGTGSLMGTARQRADERDVA